MSMKPMKKMKKNKKHQNHKNELPKYMEDSFENTEELLKGISDDKLFKDFLWNKEETRTSVLGVVLSFTNQKGKKFSVFVSDTELCSPICSNPNTQSEVSRTNLYNDLDGCMDCCGINIDHHNQM